MSSLFLTYDINSIHDSCEVVPITPSTWLDEFLEYQLQDDAEMLKDLQENKFWGLMGQKKIAGERIFNNLAALMKSPQCIPHSNASSKRTFSMMRKIVTENRTSLHHDTVCVLLNCRLNCDRSAAGFKPSKVGLMKNRMVSWRVSSLIDRARFYCTSVLPPHCGGAIPPNGDGSKWQDRSPEGLDQKVAPIVSVESQSMENPLRMRCELIIFMKVPVAESEIADSMSNLEEVLGLLVAEEEIVLVAASVLVANKKLNAQVKTKSSSKDLRSMHTRVKLLGGMQIFKLLGGYSQIIGGIYPPHPPGVSTPLSLCNICTL